MHLKLILQIQCRELLILQDLTRPFFRNCFSGSKPPTMATRASWNARDPEQAPFGPGRRSWISPRPIR